MLFNGNFVLECLISLCLVCLFCCFIILLKFFGDDENVNGKKVLD